MKCSRRSTTSFADGARHAVVLCLLLLGASVRAADEEVPPAVTAAILDAVRDEVGEGFAIEIVDLTARLTTDPTVVEAIPAPGARLSTPMRFTLVVPGKGRRSSRVRVGDAVATVHVTGPIVKTAHAIERGAVLEAADLAVVEEVASDVPLEPLLSAAELVGTETVRRLAEGEMLTSALVRLPPLVESGQLVTTVARLGRVRVQGKAVAAQRGVLGQIIRLVNPDTRRTLRGRVVAAGRVEVLRVP